MKKIILSILILVIFNLNLVHSLEVISKTKVKNFPYGNISCDQNLFSSIKISYCRGGEYLFVCNKPIGNILTINCLDRKSNINGYIKCNRVLNSPINYKGCTYIETEILNKNIVENNEKEITDYICNLNQCKFNNSCINKPTNSNCITNDNYNAWKCDIGYSEKGNICIKDVNIEINLDLINKTIKKIDENNKGEVDNYDDENLYNLFLIYFIGGGLFLYFGFIYIKGKLL